MIWKKLLKGETLIDSLNEILLQWDLKDYPSDEQRWKEYAKDIKELIHKWEAPQEYDVNWDKKAMAGAVMTSHAGLKPKPTFGKKKKRDDEE